MAVQSEALAERPDLNFGVVVGGDGGIACALEKTEVAVLHVPTIKPFDKDTVLGAIAERKCPVFTAENHTTYGGLGTLTASAVAEEKIVADLHRIALPDQYLEAGTLGRLQDMYGVSQKAVAETLKNILR